MSNKKKGSFAHMLQRTSLFNSIDQTCTHEGQASREASFNRLGPNYAVSYLESGDRKTRVGRFFECFVESTWGFDFAAAGSSGRDIVYDSRDPPRANKAHTA